MKELVLRLIASITIGIGWSGSCQNAAEFSASAGIISPPFILTNGCVFQEATTAITDAGRAVYTFTAPAGSYRIQALVDAPRQAANFLFVNIDSEPAAPGTKWEVPASSGFAKNWVGNGGGRPRLFQLTNGVHQLIIRGGAPNVKLAHVWISEVKAPMPPTNLHVVNGSL